YPMYTLSLHDALPICSYDIFSLIEKIKGIDFKEAYKYVIDYFGYKETNEHIDYNDNIDMSFFAKFNKTKEEIKLPKVDKSILNRSEEHTSELQSRFDL